MRQKQVIRLLILLAVCAGIYWTFRLLDPREVLRQALAKIDQLGPWAPIWFVVAYIVACLTFFPGVILTLGAGILFGVIKGTLLVAVGASIGAGCAFLLSRYLARNWVVAKFARNANFQALDNAVERDGWKIVGLIRLSPAFPFIPLNFVFGLTKIPFWHFYFVTLFALVPNTSLFVYLGSLIGDIAALGTRPIATGRMKWVVAAVGLISTIIVTGLVTRIVRRALTKARVEE